MSPNSSLLFSSSLSLPVCPSTRRSPGNILPPASSKQTIQDKLAHIERFYPTASVLVCRNDLEPLLAGDRSLHVDLCNAEPYIGRFMPVQRGIFVLLERSIRMSWVRCQHAVIIIAWTRRPEVARTFEKTIPRTLRSLVRLSLPTARS